ncbi:hypothetical protein QAD02_012456 [Eretmocerus hayati]|uniref:Uncharacterized protein n=1 Tax=Eretmocerus hayati TaxID=131215 RepID=A0ACC2P2B1_9HYME|nr:hypothetical protein QAD02_012456 [Eretmocerus hayati]
MDILSPSIHSLTVTILESTFCEGCPPPVTPYKGYVNVSGDGSIAVYSCETGYEFHGDQNHLTSLKRECLKHGHWNGLHVPDCVRVSCPLPGVFARGRVEGSSYSFGDKISYHCNDGYLLRGNSQRTCRANGKWSNKIPFCIGVTCKNLLAPDNGDIEYVTTEHDRDDLTILQVGQKLEFKCDAGYTLVGQSVLTCQNNGTWNFERPTCIPMSCHPPKQIQHGRFILAVTNDTHETFSKRARSRDSTKSQAYGNTYLIGDIVAFSCKPGFKFEGSHNLIEEFKLQCRDNGTWIGFVPNCKPRQCSPPTLQDAKFTLLGDGNSGTDGTQAFSTDQISQTKLVDSKNETTHNTSQLFLPGSRISISCEDNSDLVTKSTIWSCSENEIWTGEPINCEASKCSVDDHSIVKMILHASSMISSTDKQDFLDDDTESTGPGVNSVTNVRRALEIFDVSFEGDWSENKTVLTCKNLSYQEGREQNKIQLIWLCDSGRWSFVNEDLIESQIISMLLNGDTNMCSSRLCSTPVEFPRGTLIPVNSSMSQIDDTKIPIQIVGFKCHLGYNLFGPDNATCSDNRTWSHIPNCQPVKCGYPLRVPHSEMNGGLPPLKSWTYGMRVSYKCLQGYREVGHLEKLCLANGRWSRARGRCARISCGKPRIIEGASVNGTSYLYQDHLTYTCPGRKLGGTIVCNKDGRWSVYPLCQ